MQTRLYLISFAAAASLVITGCSSMPNNNQTGGTLIGGAAGAMIGSQFGHGGGSALGAGLGAVGGMLVGSAIGKSMDDNERARYRSYDRGSYYDDRYGY